MLDAWVGLPLFLSVFAAVLAALCGLPAVNRRISMTRISWVLALFPAVAFAQLGAQLPAVNAGAVLTQSWDWLPALGLRAGFYLDGLSLLFALLITGIGTLIILYGGYYFKREQSAWRFQCYMLLFMAAMLGVVLAGDLITLFVFWEATSITSFLLIGYNQDDEAARRGAFKSLIITGGGGIALLAGFLFVYAATGSTDLGVILSSGETLRESPLYLVMLLLVAAGAFTKSAQWPAHIWLPDAMAAPTPASAFLHSATMVKAGIYLMARLNPVLGYTETWFWLLSVAGAITMVTGAVLALKQNDLKALLAYTTISQLGLLMMLIGQDTQIAFKALAVGIAAHALYKAALFLVAGIVDHETGTRDLRRLGGLARAMPATTTIAVVAALSMAGLPPMFGFLAKETLLATVMHPELPGVVAVGMTGAALVTGALMFALAALLVRDVFFGRARDQTVQAHEAPWAMWLAPAVPAAISLAIGLLPEPETLAALLAQAAASGFGEPVKVSLALWTGINPPLLGSVAAIAAGAVLFACRRSARARQARWRAPVSANAVYEQSLRLADGAAWLATRAQHGRLRGYLAVMLLGTGALIALFGQLPVTVGLPRLGLGGEISLLRALIWVVTVTAAAATVLLRSDLMAILAVGASGLGVAVVMALEPSPDLALVQVVVDILAIIILVLLLTRVPAAQRGRAGEFTFGQSWFGLTRDAAIALGGAAVVGVLCYQALITRPRESVVTPYFEQHAKPLTGANDIVSAILIDFRAFDTLFEIVVFALAGLGVYTLLRFASLKAGDREPPVIPVQARILHTMGIGGTPTSPLIRVLANLALPLALVIAVAHIMYGHDQPGDGFTAGVIVSLAVGFWYVVFGYDATKRRLLWLKPAPLIGGGIALVVVSATLAAWLGDGFFGHVNFGRALGLALPEGFHFSTGFLFEVAIALCVLGGASLIIDTLGHPRVELPPEPAAGHEPPKGAS